MASKHSSASLSSKQRQLMLKKEQKMALVAQRLSMLRDDDQNCNPINPLIVTDVIPLQHDSESIHGTRNKLKSKCDDSQKQNCVSKSTHGERKKLKSDCDDSRKQNCVSESTHGTRKKLKRNCDDSRKQNCASESAHGTRKKLTSICDDSQKQNCISTATNPVRDLDQDSPCDSDEIVIPSSPSSNRKKYGSLNRRMVISDDESEQDGKIQSVIQLKESLNRRMVISDDESEQDGKIQCVIQPKERTSFAEQPVEDKLSTPMDRATKVQANLSAAYPSFVKTMLSSHVSGGFWLGLPSKFCENLPKEDCTIVLVDEAGKEFKTNYLAHKTGLSGGWRGFSIHQELQKGDVLVFHLIHPTIFKVYIVREDRLNAIDGALELLGFETCAGQIISGDSTQKVLHTEDSPPIYSSSPSGSDIDQPEVLDGIQFSDSDINFKAIKDFNNFNIIVEGLVIDSKFSLSNRKKYYDLCLSQNSFLHQHLLKGMNCNLIIGIILETINIADAIKACDSSTSIEDLQTWKTTLKGFELVGMKVDFLCDRLNQLMHIASEINQLDASNMSETYTLELGSANGRMKALEDKLAELKRVMEKIDSEIEAEMTASIQKHKARLDKIDNFPW
ncbi:B3 domain-containing protein Os01g0234100-like isoform X2 [Silene latifolia]|uniref:B3 domain-containing protein Os01g0234100-like isoform X2 n=1 Tax=Silene latifolia TaxID=37657 RepID=UPI003D76BEA6